MSGSKTWDDKDNQDGLRPEKITVNLLADGKKVASQVVTEATDWKYSFDNLAKFNSGKAVVYSISEDKVTGYETTVKGYDLTNKHIVKPQIPAKPKIPTKPSQPVTPKKMTKVKQSDTKHLPKTSEDTNNVYNFIGIILMS